jgi:uncharacterized DUF497 family protein
MRFTWDARKNRQNVARHGIAFEDAVRIFEGPTLEKAADRHDYGESRVYAIGMVNGIEVTVIYADRPNNERRIISAWKAEKHEREAYWKNIH